MGITDPTSLDIINKALRKCKQMILDVSSYDLTDVSPGGGLDDAIAYLETVFTEKKYYKFVLDSLNETYRFFDMFEGKNYLKRHVNLQLLSGVQDYEVNTANFAADFSIEKILPGEVQNAAGGFVDKMTREQYIKYVVPFRGTANQSPTLTITPEQSPRLWFPNVKSDDDGNPVTYFSIYPTVVTDQLLFIPYTKIMAEEIDAETVLDSCNIPLNDIDGAVYYLAHILCVSGNLPMKNDIIQEMDLAMLQSSIAHKWLDESDEGDLSRGMVKIYHGGL